MLACVFEHIAHIIAINTICRALSIIIHSPPPPPPPSMQSYTAAHIVGIGRRWNIEGSGEETGMLTHRGYSIIIPYFSARYDTCIICAPGVEMEL